MNQISGEPLCIRLSFQAIRMLSGMPAFVTLFSAATARVSAPGHHDHSMSVNLRTAVLSCTWPFPLLSAGCNLLSIPTGHCSRSVAGSQQHDCGLRIQRASNLLPINPGNASESVTLFSDRSAQMIS